MRRVRLALLLIAAGLLVPVALLVDRTLEGLAFEKRVRHEAVAARVFDEMERALLRFVEREESRAVGEYDFYLPADAGGDRPSRSPLSFPPPEPFVVGYFEIGADGRAHTPLLPRDPERARRHGDWPPPAASLRMDERVRAIVAAAWPAEDAAWDADLASGAAGPRREAAAGLGLEPGETAPLAPAEPLASERAVADEAPSSAYAVLQRLNRSALLRDERRRKAMPPPATSAPVRAAKAEEREAFSERDRRAPVAVDAAARSPMAARAAGPPHHLKNRTVASREPGRRVRQGLVLERDALAAWLRDEVLAASGLRDSTRAIFFDAHTAAEPGTLSGATGYVHRFGEPFDALGVVLALGALPGVGSAGAIYALCALLALVAIGGLLALYRMVALVVDFAERRSNFAAAVSHELKTPLTSVRMYAEMLREGIVESDEKRDEYLRTIGEESERLTRLIDSVLAFSQLERGRELEVRPGAVGAVVQEVTAKLRPHAQRAGFGLRAEVEPGLPPVAFDRDALTQVLFNLVDNAVKYASGTGRREIVVQTCREAGAVVVAVRDFGPGVGARHLHRVFEPFYRAGDELTRTTTGTGIGLALVKEMAERMGAAVTAANAEGGGLRVRLAFPPVRS